MNVLGIVSEYNPFHNGHKYHIDQSIKSCNADFSVCVMSGNFVQRGEPAIFDKWTRTRCALNSGINLVIELPVVFSASTAEKFAYGAVKTLDLCGIVSHLSFGSESGSLDEINYALEEITNEDARTKEKLKSLIASGISFPKARSLTFENDVLKSPNNILALEYLKAIKKIGSSIIPITVKRHKSNYHDNFETEDFASASHIRSMIHSGDDITHLVPGMAHAYPVYPEYLDEILTYTLRKMTREEISKIADVSEGLENKIKRAAQSFYGFNEIANDIKTKRYTLSRIKRILICSVLGITDYNYEPEYIRILGMDKKGMLLLKEMKSRAKAPVITKLSKAHISPMLSKDLLASDIYSILSKEKSGNSDYLTSPIVL